MLLIILAIAAPWHILATLRNPPYFDFTMKSEPGHYHGFFWFYFFNEHVFRFLNMRHPRDYNTVPRIAFWLFHLLWLFPWSAFFPATVGLSVQAHRSRRAHAFAGALLDRLHPGLLHVFDDTGILFDAVLSGAGFAAGLRVGQGWQRSTLGPPHACCPIASLCVVAIIAILSQVHSLPTPGDISNALTQNPDAYTLSLGHMGDLTLASFAYLRLPLVVAGIAFLIGALGCWFLNTHKAVFAIAVMMTLFFHAARLALVVFDPYLSSRPLAQALLDAPPGKLIAGQPILHILFGVLLYESHGPAA